MRLRHVSQFLLVTVFRLSCVLGALSYQPLWCPPEEQYLLNGHSRFLAGSLVGPLHVVRIDTSESSLWPIGAKCPFILQS